MTHQSHLATFLGWTWTALGAFALCASAQAAADPLVQRGEYVARAADCMSCHTAPGGKMYAGGDQLKTIFGSIFGPNITPDVATGIGSWSKQDFVNVLRKGIRKDGSPLYPAMPYADYTKMTDADVDALWAYLRTIPAVHQYVPPADKTFKFPFNIREGMWAWQAVFFKPERWQPTPAKSPEWNRGNYLVTLLGHCGECHTPKNIAKAQETSYHLTGGQLEGWYAPDISNDPMSGINKYSVNDIATFLKSGNLPGNVKVFGPMEETIHDSLRYLTDQDLHAIAFYLKTEPVPHSKAPKPTTISPASLARGKALYENNCSSCHQDNGRGLPHQVPALDGNTAVTALQPNDLVMAMLEGFGPSQSWGAMGSFKQLTDQQIADIANYVRMAWSNHAEPNAVAWSVGNWRRMADIPAKERQPDLICPLLPAPVVEPALKEPPALLRQAATDHRALEQVVHTYVSAEPHVSAAQTVEALTTAYCRAIVAENIPTPLSSAKVADFAQDVAMEIAR
jgi:mono/diheme cytochrome c family protein